MLWQGLYLKGHEYAHLTREASAWRLEGVAAFSHQGDPCRLDYLVRCNRKWKTTGAKIWGWVGDVIVGVELKSDAKGRWFFNDAEVPEVAGCLDLDLNFSPSTNLLPIRRLGLAVGGQATVRAAWLRFPTFRLEPLEQTYARLTDDSYRYTSGGGTFSAVLRVDAEGFVVDYPGIWVAESGTP